MNTRKWGSLSVHVARLCVQFEKIWNLGINSARESSSGKHGEFVGILDNLERIGEINLESLGTSSKPYQKTSLVEGVICGPCCYRSQKFAFASPQHNIDVMCPSNSLIQPALESKFS